MSTDGRLGTDAWTTRREELLAQLADPRPWDMVIIGGGATGLGVALDAATRGLRVALIDSHDFAKGTSSRATKLVHGGVRYLAQGNIALVREALHERATLLNNAPHLAQPLPFVMPSYRWWETAFYGVGLKAYDLLAGRAGLGATELLATSQVLDLMPTVQSQRLRGGVKYWDGQFDDARLALALARTAAQEGAVLVNYCPASELLYESGRIAGVLAHDGETGRDIRLASRCIINATGVWVDHFRRQDGQALARPVQDMVAPSQGVHLVVSQAFLPGSHALIIPKTADGRVLFAVPWLGKLILGTTDTPRHDLAREPEAFHDEVEFILSESARYLARAPRRADVLSHWVGLRPLVKPQHEEGDSTKALSREHTVLVSRSGLVTVTGGKWTTYRAMAEDVLGKCMEKSLIQSDQPSVTANFRLIGASPAGVGSRISAAPGPHLYGSEAALLQALPGHGIELGGGLSEAMVRFAARHEYARRVEDVLARRSRLLFLDAALAARIAPRVAAVLQQETGRDPALAEFLVLAARYLALP